MLIWRSLRPAGIPLLAEADEGGAERLEGLPALHPPEVPKVGIHHTLGQGAVKGNTNNPLVRTIETYTLQTVWKLAKV